MLFFNKSINIIVTSNCPVNGIYISNNFLVNYVQKKFCIKINLEKEQYRGTNRTKYVAELSASCGSYVN